MSYILSNWLDRNEFIFCPVCATEVETSDKGWPNLKCPRCNKEYSFGLEPDMG
jgi:NADH pyrophosphatase NudC (nudix superfamily)